VGLKIVYASDNYWPRFSGMAVSIDSFKHELERRGHTVHVFASEYPGGYEKDRELGNSNIHRFKSHKTPISEEDRLVNRSEKRNVWKELDRISPDIIHVQTEFNLCKMIRKYAFIRKIPLVMTCHTYFEQYINHYVPWLPRSLARWYARRYTYNFYHRNDRLLTPSPLMKDVLRSYGITQDITVIPTGIPEEDFSGVRKEEERNNSMFFESFPELKDRRRLLFVGRIGGEKNVMFLLPVLKKVSEEVKDVHLMMVGDGPQKDEMKRKAKEMGLSLRISFLGYVDRKDIKHAFSLADVFTFPSKTETQGLVTVESMICRTPVVAIGEMGTKHVMRGDNGGYMVNEDVDEFSDKVTMLLKDDDLYRSKSMEAYRYSREWTMKVMGDRMLEVYQKLVRKGS
jgi:glycosyltransferase involved in cell wall biosynthesis